MTSKPAVAPLLTPARQQSDLAGQFSSFIMMVRKEFTVMTRYPVEFVASFGQIFFIVAIFTLAGLTFNPAGMTSGGGSTGTLTIYGFVIFLFLSDTLWNIGFRVRQEQVQGTLEQLYLSPANKFLSILSRVTTILIWTSLLSVTGVFFMTTLIGQVTVHNPLLGIYVLLIALLGMFGVGFAFAAVTLRLKETANTLINLIQFAFMILTANFFPFSALPEPALFVSRLIPISYAVDAFRSALMGFPPGYPELAPFEVELVIITIFGIVMPVIGFYLYRAAENYARRRGSLSEY